MGDAPELGWCGGEREREREYEVCCIDAKDHIYSSVLFCSAWYDIRGILEDKAHDFKGLSKEKDRWID